LATSVIFTAGCGMGVMSTASSHDEPLEAATIHGKAMGGSTPIVGATATLWTTASNGAPVTGLAGGYYSGTASVLATTTTGTNGSFTFTTPCTKGYDQAYITFSGGNSGAGVSNPNILLMAALGPCYNLPNIPFVIVNEVTTVGAAYALAGFTSISSSTSGGVTTNAVNITSSATNYATNIPGQTGSIGTIYHPVGLQHAFLNATNLVDVPAGVAFGYLPTQGTGGTAVMPNALINSVANVLQACTNSAGATPEITFTGSGGTLTSSTLGTSDTLSGALTLKVDGSTYNLPSATNTWSNVSQATVLSAVQAIPGLSTSTFSGGVLTIIDTNASPSLTVGNPDAQYTGTGSASKLLDVPASSSANICSQVFAAALPLGSTTAPTNILQAALNIARNPYMGGAGKAATFLGLSSGTGANPYSPTLTVSGAGTTGALPHDLTAAIFYPKTTGTLFTGGVAATYLSAASLDANDNYYMMAETGGTTAYYTYEFLSLAGNGAPGVAHQYCTSSTYNQSTCNDPIGGVTRIEADALGNIWMVAYQSDATGATTIPTSTYATSQSGVYQITASTGLLTGPANTATQESVYSTPYIGNYSIAIDQRNDIFIGNEYTGGTLSELTNTNASPTTAGTYASAATAVGSAATKYEYQIAIDASQNVYASNYNSTSSSTGDGVYVLPNQTLAAAPTYPVTTTGTLATTPVYASTLVGTNVTDSYGYAVATDASGNVYFSGGSSTTAGGSGDGVYVTTPVYTAATSGTYSGDYSITSFTTPTGPIVGAALSTTAGTVNLAISRPYMMQPDGDGAIWFGDYAGDTVVRLYGTTTSASVMAYYPCVGTTCYTVYTSGNGLYGAKETYIDSTGAVWELAPAAANVAQIFGVGAPSFPLRAAGHPGQMP
jgi:hypothetical protein